MQTKSEELAAKVVAVNKANAGANALQALLRTFFEPYVGQKIVKACGNLLAKIESKMPDLEALTKEYGLFQIYKSRSPYSLSWTVRTCEPVGDHGCTYYEVSVCIGDMKGDTLEDVKDLYIRTTDYKAADITEKRQKFEAAKKEMEEARSALWPFGE